MSNKNAGQRERAKFRTPEEASQHYRAMVQRRHALARQRKARREEIADRFGALHLVRTEQIAGYVVGVFRASDGT